jgi:group I intron endonuclease
MTAGIYAIECSVDGKVYIGSSINVEHRWKQHLYNLTHNRHSSCKLQNAWNVYGEAAFECVFLEKVTDLEKLTAVEQKYIDSYNSFANGYNSSQFACKSVSSQMPVSLKRLTVRIPSSHYDAFIEYCQKHHQTPDRMIARYTNEVVSTPESEQIDPWEKLAEKYGTPSKKTES